MTLFTPGRNVWNVDRAERAKVLIDAAPYFGALREALKKARHTVFVIGWDINSRVPLVGESGCAEDGYPEPFCEFLCALIKERPNLQINILLWDFSVLYSTEREIFPALSLGWKMPERIQLCLDDALPLGSAHHQKIVVIDDCLAFSGGLDITHRRWDTCEHDFDNPKRKDTAGKPYRPFHDVQMMVDGPAAKRIGELARIRWKRATLESVHDVRECSDCWPEAIEADFRNIDIGISLTQPRYDQIPEQDEVEQLFLDSVALAERTIYIENQFLTRLNVAERIAERMREKPELEAIFIAPHTHESWIEARTMRIGRIAFRKIFDAPDLENRVRFLYPKVVCGENVTDTMVHSKVMIIDDVFLRVGSANLNNRSMGTDTECDLSIEAADDETRAVIAHLRDTLLAEHCGVTAKDIAASLKETHSLLKTADTLTARGHSLCPVEDGEPDPKEIAAAVTAVADPERTVGIETFITHLMGERVPYRHISHSIQVAIGCLIVIALVLAWRYTPLSELTDPDTLRSHAVAVAESYWGPVLVIGVFVAAGFVLFPLTILIAVTAGAFGPWLGLIYAAAGAVASSLTTYLVGARVGKSALRKFVGPRLNRVTRRVAEKGVLAVAAVRLVPVAPFTVVNLVAGASGIRFTDFLIGTALGLLPGLIVLSSLGNQIFRVLADPSVADVFLFIALVVGWVCLSFGLQLFVTRIRGARA
ncbi:VTT domain-containing protein [Terrihabitans soli]|nr:VTT domain-containing protein [Terrihabitans soli]